MDFLPAPRPRRYELFFSQIPEWEWESFLSDWYPPFTEMYAIWKWRGRRGRHCAPTVSRQIPAEEESLFVMFLNPGDRSLPFRCTNTTTACLSFFSLYDIIFFHRLSDYSAAEELYLLVQKPSLLTPVLKQAGASCSQGGVVWMRILSFRDEGCKTWTSDASFDSPFTFIMWRTVQPLNMEPWNDPPTVLLLINISFSSHQQSKKWTTRKTPTSTSFDATFCGNQTKRRRQRWQGPWHFGFTDHEEFVPNSERQLHLPLPGWWLTRWHVFVSLNLFLLSHTVLHAWQCAYFYY